MRKNIKKLTFKQRKHLSVEMKVVATFNVILVSFTKKCLTIYTKFEVNQFSIEDTGSVQ